MATVFVQARIDGSASIVVHDNVIIIKKSMVVALFKQASADDSITGIKLSPPENFVSLRPKHISDRLALPSLRGYDSALTGCTDGQVYLQAIDDYDFFADKEFGNGCLVIKGRPDIRLSLENIRAKRTIRADDFDVGLLLGIYSVIFRSAEQISGNCIAVRSSQLAGHLGFSPRGINAFPILEKLQQFSGIIGVLPDGSFYNLLAISSYDRGNDLITLDCGFILKMIRSMQQDAIRTSRIGKQNISVTLPCHNFLWQSNVASTRNKNALQIAILLTDLVLQAGEQGKPHIRCSTLIDRIPSLSKQIMDQPETKNRNTILHRAFTRAYELIREKSDAYNYWIDLEIQMIIPTMSRLGSVISIRHDGVNKDFEKGHPVL